VVDVETIVIGGGAMGSAAAWQLASRGRDVLLLERFAAGHSHGASHGASRNFNVSYSDPTYLSMLVEALPLWRVLEEETSSTVLDLVGVVNHGHRADFDDVFDALGAVGIPAEFLPPAEAARRWPGIRFDNRVLHTPQAGRLNADRSVAALQSAATALGATVRHGARVLRLRVLEDDAVSVTYVTDGGSETITARTAIVTVGAWSEKLLAGVAVHPALIVTQEQPAHFAVLDDSVSWPGFNHAPDPADARYDYWYSGVYGTLTPGEGVKVGWHGTGAVVDPDARSYLAEPKQFEALRRYARDWLPGVDADAASPISCTYTTSPDSNFILDRVGPVVIGAGFSGHGFKFTPVVGRILADLVDRAAPAPALFSLSASR
jgi:sarcosine oxidase